MWERIRTNRQILFLPKQEIQLNESKISHQQNTDIQNFQLSLHLSKTILSNLADKCGGFKLHIES
jgi:hypothetical protein